MHPRAGTRGSDHAGGALSDDGNAELHARRTPGTIGADPPEAFGSDGPSSSGDDFGSGHGTVGARLCRDPATRALMFYFVSSIALTIFNKWFFSSHNQLGFHFPLTVTCIHQMFVYVLVVLTETQLRNRGFGEIARAPSLRVPLGTLGAFCGIDWGLSNLSLRYIPLSLYEMTKSASPAMVLLLSAAMGLMVFTKRIAAIVILVCTGMFLSVSGGSLKVFRSEAFPLFGFTCVATATFISGGRIVYAQHALQRLTVTPVAGPEGSPAGGTTNGVNAVTMLYYSAPLSSLALVLPAMYLEGAEIEQWFAAANRVTIFKVAFAIISSASIAYSLSLSEFFATRQTSALTLCVVGVTKQLLLIGLAMAIFGDRLGIVNVAGFVIALFGVSFYNYAKKTGAMAREQQRATGAGPVGESELQQGSGSGALTQNVSISSPVDDVDGAATGHEMRPMLQAGSVDSNATGSDRPAFDAHLRSRGGTGKK